MTPVIASIFTQPSLLLYVAPISLCCSLERTLAIGFRAHTDDSGWSYFNILNDICNTLFPNKVIFTEWSVDIPFAGRGHHPFVYISPMATFIYNSRVEYLLNWAVGLKDLKYLLSGLLFIENLAKPWSKSRALSQLSWTTLLPCNIPQSQHIHVYAHTHVHSLS